MKRMLQTVAALSMVPYVKTIIASTRAILCLPNATTTTVNVPVILFGTGCIFFLIGVMRLRPWARSPATILLGLSSALGLANVSLVWCWPSLLPPGFTTLRSLVVIHFSAAIWTLCLVMLLITGKNYMRAPLGSSRTSCFFTSSGIAE